MTDIKDIFKKVSLKRNGRLFGFGTSTKYDWEIIFFSSFVLTLVTAGLCLFVFVQVNRGEIFQSESEEKAEVKPLDTTLLEGTVSYYLGKQVEFARLIKLKASSTDPSL